MMNKLKQTAVFVVLVMALLGVGLVLANPNASYDLTWWTVDSGGGSSSGGSYALNGTTGQPDAGALQGGVYGLDGGFWGGAAQTGSAVYLPVVVR
ncbi:MAG: hypothetical protein D6816_17325 [Bacteroidetes bacterium]|nr:MAG: hypothetical protein D6816_17325 [Bacteroidota bacterium]